MRNFLKTKLVIVFAMSMSACTTTSLTNQSNTQSNDTPTDTGVAAPQNLLAALDGGLITRGLGKQIARGDLSEALQSEYRALEYTAPGEAVLWQGDSMSGRVIPSQPYRVGSQDCRQYEHTINDKSAQSVVKGTACRNEDGSWSLLS